MIKSFKVSYIVPLIFIILTGCSSNVVLEPDSKLLEDENSQGNIVTYKIGVGDVIDINVWNNAELSVSVPVRPDGMISMPLVGDVLAAGNTPEKVSRLIEKKLESYIRNPNVTLMVTGLISHEYLTRVRITGAVNTPSSIYYRQGMTVLDAILAAGSVNDFASPNRTKLYRTISNRTAVVPIYLGDILYEGKLDTNIEIRPGDVITVPERLF
jgi:polysaccharide export outer membrane protein